MQSQSKNLLLTILLCLVTGCSQSSSPPKPEVTVVASVDVEPASLLADVPVEDLYLLLDEGAPDEAETELRRRGSVVVGPLLEQILAPKTILSANLISAKTTAEEIIVSNGRGAIPAIEQHLERLMKLEIPDENLVIPESEDQYSGSSHAFAMETLSRIAQRVMDSINN